ncbi:MAG TPA: PadR family transcriptional regulator [Edaphobacter sp.]|jgi:DNA-binding PadR family transcriptional regulator
MKKMEGGATPNALLGLLSLGPMSGYDIRQLISESIGHFWSESYGQIYPGLKRLSAAGFVVKRTERGKGSPDRHVYSLTAEGREQLRRWLKVPVAKEVPRNELLLKLFFGAQVSSNVSREHVQDYLERQQKELQVYGAIAKKLRKEEGKDSQLPFWLMTLSMGRHRSAAMVKWCKETLAELEVLERRQKGGK